MLIGGRQGGKTYLQGLADMATEQPGNRLAAEAARLREFRASSAIPAECGPDIAPAPGRGGFVLHHNVELLPVGEKKVEAVHRGYGGRAAIRTADVFDRMIAAAERARKPWPLTPGQIAVGRRYRDLVEWRAAGGIKCSAPDGRQAGSGERDFMDAYLAVGQEVEGMHRRIGAGVAMPVRRIRPKDRGVDQRGAIHDRALVDMVCLQQMLLTEVLRRHGWSTKGPHRDALREALSGALDRMIGYFPKKTC